MDKAAAYHAVRLLPRLTNGGMLVVIVLQLARFINPGIGLLDVIALALVGVAARTLLRSGKLKPPT